MSGVYDSQADIYLDARPTYPADWYSKLAALSHRHNLAWDAGTGNGQAAIGVCIFSSLSFFFLTFPDLKSRNANL
jgi:hypothetical protein